MTRSNPDILHSFDPEIDRTFHHRIHRRSSIDLTHSSSSIDSVHFATASELDLSDSASDISDFVHSDSVHSHIETMVNNNRTLKELAAPDVNYQTLCIQYPEVKVPFVLKTGLIHLLLRFHGLAGEDPHKHLKEFHIVCATMTPQGVPKEHVKLKAFPFSLQDIAKDWLYYLPLGSITSWDNLKRLFLEKFFPASRAASIRKEICNILLFLPYLPIIRESLIIFCVHVEHEFKVEEPLNPYPDESLEVSGEFLGPIVFWLSFTHVCGPKSTFLSRQKKILPDKEKNSQKFILAYLYP